MSKSEISGGTDDLALLIEKMSSVMVGHTFEQAMQAYCVITADLMIENAESDIEGVAGDVSRCLKTAYRKLLKNRHMISGAH